LKIGDKITLTIDRLSYDGGRGVGRFNNFVFFVPDTAPNEQVSAQITELKKNYGVARLVDIIKPSGERVIARCPVVSTCGGCSWQHVSYPEQLRQKHQFLLHYLKKFLPPDFIVPSIVPSPNEFNYRNRVQVHAMRSPTGAVEYGFFKKGTNNLVKIKACDISENILFESLESELSSRISVKDKKLRKFELAINNEGNRVIRDLNQEESEFSQVNSKQNDNLKDYILIKINQSEKNVEVIYDLYCGSGNITVPLAKAFPNCEIIGVESNVTAIEQAKQNKLANTTYFAKDVFSYLQQVKTTPPAAIVLDPARAGLSSEVINELLRLEPQIIVYVSCSLPSLARDLALLCSKYKIHDVCGFDMFPQTDYLESIVTLLPRAIDDFCVR
jgi:tRNA/tmRNA/rRNA uracil-C5-methylase (TrmA/RlmC/RlmD family)